MRIVGRGLLPKPADVQKRLDELRGYWEFSAVCQFFHLFHQAYGWDHFDTDEFELDLVSEGANPKIQEILMKLLRAIVYYPRGLTPENWERHTREQLLFHGVEEDLFEDSEKTFFDLSLRNKLLIFHYFTEWQWDDPVKFKSMMKFKGDEEEEEEWRVEPIGVDSDGCNYWLFDDNRMYKETLVNRKRPVSKKKGAAAAEKERAAREKDQEEDGKEPEDKWELVCLTREDWIEFPKEFADSEHTNDRRLVQYIEENVLPKVMEVLEDLEEEKKKKEALEHARRSTRVQAKELHKTEQEKQDALKRAKEDEEAQKYADGEKAKHEKEKNTAQSRAERAKERENKLMQLMIEEKEREEREEKERTRLERIERLQQHGSRRQPGEKPKPDEDDDDIWWFCCGCGEQGWCYDDGSEMIECDSCRVWQHTGCLGVKSALYQGKEFLCPACGGGKRPRKAQRATVTETLSDHYEEDDLEGQLEVVAPPRKRGRPRTRIAPSASPPPASTATTAKASTVAPKPKRPVVSIPTDGLRPKNAAAGMFPTGGQNGLAIPPQFRPGPRPGGFAFMPPPGMMPPNFHGIAGQPGMMPSLYPMGQSWVAATQGQPGTMYPSGPIMMAPGMHMFPQMAYGVPGHFPPGFRPLQPSMPPGQQPQTAPGPIR